MLVRRWRLATILVLAVSMSAAFAHLLEMPAKLSFDGQLWLELLQSLYPPAFGPVSGTAEGLALIMMGVLAFLLRHRRRAFGWSLLALLCMAAAHAAFWVFVSPVNAALVPLSPDALPADWASLRDQWEYT